MFSYAIRRVTLGILLLAPTSFLFGQVRPDGTARLTLEDLVSVTGPGAPVLSPDGKHFAITRDGQLSLMPADGVWPFTLTSTAGGKSGASWSPDSKELA